MAAMLCVVVIEVLAARASEEAACPIRHAESGNDLYSFVGVLDRPHGRDRPHFVV